ncbi:MAG TPA: S8 family serine peptidase [Ignavibacteriaceae bacterium]|nr:S8 family serine peptidase [Ignavibacteriaceae bacterium]
MLSKQDYTQAEKLLSQKSLLRRKKVMGENYITFEDLPLKTEYIHQIASLGIKIERRLRWFNAVSAYLSEAQIEQLLLFPFVEKIVPVKNLRSKNDPEGLYDGELFKPGFFGKNVKVNQLNYGSSFDQLNLIDVPAVHSRGITGQNVLVGFLDSGFDWKEHEALKNSKIIGEYDFVFNDSVTANQPGDSPSQHDHGTEVFSTVAGFKDSTLIGAAFGASFVLAKTEDIRSETMIEEDNYAAALEWMDSIGVDITSSSLGYNQFDDSTTSYTYNDMNGMTTIVTKAAELAFSRGIVTITAAGNEGMTPWGFIIAPADGFNTIAVGAVSHSNILESFSSHGPTSDGRIKPEVVAQGSGNFAAVPSLHSYTYSFGGTSAATPLVCGVATLLLSAYPHLLNTQIRSILLKTADNSEHPDNQRGYGLVSASKAISFPNLEMKESVFKLHKIFIDYPDINPLTAKVYYFTDSANIQQGDLVFDGVFKFEFQFPSFQSNQTVYFYFTFSDSSGSSFREPAEGNYRFIYGQNIVSSVKSIQNLPSDYILSQNFPNPFPSPSNPSTTILYKVPLNEFVTLKIYDILGNEVKTVVNGYQSSGWYSIKINSAEFASGVYFYQLKAGSLISVKKMIVLK